MNVKSDRFERELPTHDSDDLIGQLESLSPALIDQLPFGVIGFDKADLVVIYNELESEISGISPKRVLGCDLFTEVAPCTNNFLVAERYRTAGELDEWLDYVFTLRMQPTPVRLRLLASPTAELSYMIVVRPPHG